MKKTLVTKPLVPRKKLLLTSQNIRRLDASEFERVNGGNSADVDFVCTSTPH